MAHVALKWDNRFIRVAVANTSRGVVQFDRALSVELAGESGELSPSRVGDKLRAIMEKVGVHRGDATVILTRGEVEMRQFDLPPVPSDELPDMVRFQARNHFSSFSDDFLLDYIPVTVSDESNTVLAAAISGEQAQKIRDTVDAAGLKLKHIVVRPFAAAELVRAADPSSRCRVLVEMIGHEADLSVVRNDYVLMTRTVRVPESYSSEQFGAWMPGELRRTIASAQGQSGAQAVDEIVICGEESEHEHLARELRDAFDFPVRFFQPLDAIQKSSRFEQPAQHDGFASLLGSLVQSVNTDTHALDFLNPRKKPEAVHDRRKLYIAGGVAASVALMGLLFVWWLFRQRDNEIAQLRSDIAGLQEITDVSDVVLERTQVIDDWRSHQYDWLERLHELSLLLPGPQEARLNRLLAEVKPDGGGVNIKGLIAGDDNLAEVQHRFLATEFDPKLDTTPTSVDGFDQSFVFNLELAEEEFTPGGERKNERKPSATDSPQPVDTEKKALPIDG